jgi:hypothetical protein
VSWLGAAPVDKIGRGLVTPEGASRFTNWISYVGLRAFPGAKMPVRLLRTTRIAGALGRANVLLAAGLAAYDVTSIALCSAGLEDYQIAQ